MIPTFLARFGRNLLYGFRWKLRPYEAAILEHVFKASTASDRAALQLHLDSRELVQRWADRILYFGLPPRHNLPRVVAATPNYCYAKVKLASPAGKIVAKIMTHRGILHTVEFSKAPTPLLSNGFTVQSVSLHPGGGGYAAEIDAIEHGSAD